MNVNSRVIFVWVGRLRAAHWQRKTGGGMGEKKSGTISVPLLVFIQRF
jgi:hypothetical protein